MLYDDIKKRVTGWVTQRRAIHNLKWLDDRLLSDMGVAREEIPSRVRGKH